MYTDTRKIWFTQGNEQFVVPKECVKLWWPAGFGDPDLCWVKIEMLQNGHPVADWASDWGIRTVHLDRTEDILADGTGEFVFIVNGQKTYIRGTNWKPADVFPALADAVQLLGGRQRFLQKTPLFLDPQRPATGGPNGCT